MEIVKQVADFYVATKQFKEAIPLYQRVIDMDPGQNAARENLARCYLGTEQPEKAADALEDSDQGQPRPAARLRDAGENLRGRRADRQGARQDYEQSLLVSPERHAGLREPSRMLLLDLKQPEKAVTVLNEARKRFPDRPGFAYLLAVALEEAKQHQQALAMFEQTEAEAQRRAADAARAASFISSTARPPSRRACTTGRRS